MEVGQNPGDLYRNLDIGSPDVILNKPDTFIPFVIPEDLTSIEYSELSDNLQGDSHLTKHQTKPRPIVFQHIGNSLNCETIQREDSGISGSPRTTPEPSPLEILSPNTLSNDVNFDSSITSQQGFEVVSNLGQGKQDNIERAFHNTGTILKNKTSEADTEQSKVEEADANRNSVWPSKLGENFESPSEYYADLNR